MEAMGRDGVAGGPSWSYRRRHEEIGSSSYTISSSSRSGTIVSSAAYISGSSRLSSGICMEAAALLELELELKLGTPEPSENDAEFAQAIKKHRKEIDETTLKETRMKRIERLVQEFLGGGGDGMGSLDSWFSELGASWVLQLDVGASALGYDDRIIETCKDSTMTWIKAFTQIMETIHLTEYFFPDNGHSSVGMPGINEEEEVDSGKQAATSLDPVQFALFFQEAMSKMLVFVDVVFTYSICIHAPLCNTPSVSLHSCLDVHRALSDVLLGIRLQFHSSHPAEIEKIEKEMVSLLSAKQGKAFDAIWSFMEERRTRVLKSMEDSLVSETPQESSDIHRATCSVMDHIKFLLHNCWAVDTLFVSQAARLGKYVPQTGLEEEQPFISMIAEMVSHLEEKLIAKSQSFFDKGLGLLFLLNNLNFIREELQDSLSRAEINLAAIINSITRKVEHYTEGYIKVSWEPMLACLFNPTPPSKFESEFLCLVRKYSPLFKFESEFQMIHNTQMLWNVPDPELRRRLRKILIEKIIPGYTKYIEDSKVTNPKFTPKELEEMLQELFEG